MNPRLLKRQLESDILKLVRVFENATNMCVTDLDISRLDISEVAGDTSQAINIEATVKL